jgi:hypothetical protein
MAGIITVTFSEGDGLDRQVHPFLCSGLSRTISCFEGE